MPLFPPSALLPQAKRRDQKRPTAGFPVLLTLPFVCARDGADYGHLMLFFQFGIDWER
jgi:hypothetical protein